MAYGKPSTVGGHNGDDRRTGRNQTAASYVKERMGREITGLAPGIQCPGQNDRCRKTRAVVQGTNTWECCAHGVAGLMAACTGVWPIPTCYVYSATGFEIAPGASTTGATAIQAILLQGEAAGSSIVL